MLRVVSSVPAVATAVTAVVAAALILVPTLSVDRQQKPVVQVATDHPNTLQPDAPIHVNQDDDPQVAPLGVRLGWITITAIVGGAVSYLFTLLKLVPIPPSPRPGPQLPDEWRGNWVGVDQSGRQLRIDDNLEFTMDSSTLFLVPVGEHTSECFSVSVKNGKGDHLGSGELCRCNTSDIAGSINLKLIVNIGSHDVDVCFKRTIG